MREILLYGKKAAGRVALVDDGDFELVSQYRWYVQEKHLPGQRPYGPYAVTSWREGSRMRNLRMHKLITGFDLTDHKNHNTLDNQRSNLRPASGRQSLANTRPFGKSKFKGVAWNKRLGKWQVSIRLETGRKYLGVFDNEIEAALVYDAEARTRYADYEFLNFPDGLTNDLQQP